MTIIKHEVDASATITLELVNSLNNICKQVENDKSAKVLHLNIRAMAPIQSLNAESEKDVYLVHKWEKVIRRIENLDALVVTTAESDVLAAALAILVVSDYRIATNATTFSVMQEAYIFPGVLIHRLVNQIGHSKSRSLILLGKGMDAAQANQAGLIDEIADETDAALERFVAQMHDVVFNDIRVRRRLMLEAYHTSFDDTIGLSLAACDKVLRQFAMAS
ncbi:enoyl-CoA hydratase/isomerase family protein [Pseudoalteromonas sp. JBTF-M23]|uniref:Enoyl-CoA hydratase/isomerase family protein n=1 Tax=Pseudoalteromonas caenipelagi TaxID=2726988 RepID=A0A849VGU4_9GAMM|nr:enoyl-CoA-hydratase DpgB [Pseudoalteromonas caenipelagi]NOU52632.1 enoyl-CoA hydratase/isomerase family protein [Pseudoalteromonas caenipelagi]